ncbi:hypothetical protein Scep_029853 [Stephania cephalantha]|uniref:Reverse transcriptase domain-containing protein n=1 Tax=Stephania cephalantha TaxID=152367 RepID=A0AAP0HG07_9MAGN
MKEDHFSSKNSLILGRPFLKTAKAKIEVLNETLTMEVDNETINFNIHDAMKYPLDISSVCTIDMLDPIIDITFRNDKSDKLEKVIEDLNDNNDIDEDMEEIMNALESYNTLPELSYYMDLLINHSEL